MDDRVRSLALGGACAAFIAVPVLGPLLGKGEQTRRFDTVITPPGYAFVVWAPVFAGCALSTVGRCLPEGRSHPVSRLSGWPRAGAYAANTAWSLAAQSDRFAATPFLLSVAVGFAAAAHVRLQRATPTTAWTAVSPASTGLLLGWTALAGVVNLAAAGVASGGSRTAPRTVAASAAGLFAAAGALAAGVVRSRRGALPLAAASGWGLLTTALAMGRPRSVRVAAEAGVVMLVAAVGSAATRRG
ncbi:MULTISPECIES: hypothetical protein [unclassified Micromonospora]|uniref:hypothetical protein n=1 Tax=unclassified Micromonospora TaxID=2617518 RepID=UPI001C21F7C1|nr:MULTISPECIES: hypothetical protein [unclassified Micromonospora]MBU8855834.1 hypothetical protein [Micromonospora sp. WMMB482]MBU8861854.1 hypothetical protein [Micromonospora sp. WMMB482]MDM4781435.1 hypothetical protein [Micromonospora sp. b486]